jgi:hypothetical protein
MEIPILRWIEGGRAALRLRDLPALMLGCLALILTIYPQENPIVRGSLAVLVVAGMVWGVVTAHSNEERVKRETRVSDRALHARADTHDEILRDIQRTLIERLPTARASLVSELFLTASDLGDWLDAEETRALKAAWKGLGPPPILPGDERGEKLHAARRREEAKAFAAFDRDFAPRINRLLAKARTAGYPDSELERLMQTPNYHIGDLLALRFNIEMAAVRIAEQV